MFTVMVVSELTTLMKQNSVATMIYNQYMLMTIPISKWENISLGSGLENPRHILPNSNWVLKNSIHPIWKPLSYYIYSNFVKSQDQILLTYVLENVIFFFSKQNGQRPCSGELMENILKSRYRISKLAGVFKRPFCRLQDHPHCCVVCAPYHTMQTAPALKAQKLPHNHNFPTIHFNLFIKFLDKKNL